MRLTGWVLLLIGGLLCATISWAALGFLLMGVGLIALQVAERGRRPADAAVPAAASGFTPPHLSDGLQPPTLDPVAGQNSGPQRPPRRVAWPDKNNDAPYDREAWRRLVESDPDLAQIANVLADYGPQYVDELAGSYLAAPDKGRLAAIVDGIIARARDGQPVPPPPAPVEASRPPPLPPRPEPKPVIIPAAKPATSPSNRADALEASLLATVEEASARIAAERAGLFKPAKELNKEPGEATDSRPQAAGQREPLFGRAARDAKPAGPPPVPVTPPPMPAAPPPMPADLEASLIAAVNEAAVRRADAKDTPKPAQEPAPSPAKHEPEVRGVAPAPPPAPPAKTPPAKTPADHLDETLLAALAEISGQKIKGEPKPDAASKGPSGPPADDGLSDMIKKFAPDSNFLRKT
ncbi:hypothetical protein ABIF38_001029 [Bradyrhizobium japonicum]|uniref:Uncharacterized protein n=1 Tax=Bradyrhizobium elkanii TaxID=29448 RepID=A0ABV4ERA5_BRAEL|nr:hypothetical protein [Bradyrhizobium elkanii]MBP2429876.1 hypothetical protein [Bradyrhizobium elkanii]MCP1736653.1 hypothetical protein [Bradyrhizobium elkanii]MCP1754699.1 hypothetical protein [Bradyrhizobium elkanii]MCP1980215.1 hypothetical protein [Bradyrhizobium elkanii]MCS3571993.1 hypothetical protein [Bradyrhizobium elkanii]